MRPSTDKDSPLKRAKTDAIKASVLLFLGLLYTAVCLNTDFRIPCPFFSVTGLKCPGCGVTRMCLFLAQGDPKSAFYANPAVFLSAPLILSALVLSERRYILSGRRTTGPALNALICADIVALLIFAVVRNLV